MKEIPSNKTIADDENSAEVSTNTIVADPSARPGSRNSAGTQPVQPSNKASWPVIVGILIVVLLVTWQFAFNKPEPVVAITEPVKEEIVEATVVDTDQEPTIVEPVVIDPQAVDVEPITIDLPLLDESDELVKARLPSLTMRTKLLKLLVGDDMIRRLVVFTDNFAQGAVAYEHSPLIRPSTKFSMDDNKAMHQEDDSQRTWRLDETQSERFTVYVELLHSLDKKELVNVFHEFKPLFDQAYQELGYEDDFTNVLQEAINRVLAMEIPNEPLMIVRPSVMYKFQNAEVENLPGADKLLLRLGKENLLVLKSVLIDLNEALEK